MNGVEREYIENFGDGFYVVGEEARNVIVEISVSVPVDDEPCCWDVGEAGMEYTIEFDRYHVIGKSCSPDLQWAIICSHIDTNGDCGEIICDGLQPFFVHCHHLLGLIMN